MTRADLSMASMLVAILAGAACSKETNIAVTPGAQAGQGGAAGMSSTGAAGESSAAGGQATLPDCAGGTSPGKAGPMMVRVPSHPGGSCFWMDATEVTRGDYKAFVAEKKVPGSLSTECAFNDSYEDEACETTSPLAKAGQINTDDSAPAVCVDWCDAEEYCRFAGKQLCKGDAAAPDQASTSSWFSACTNAGTTTLPYGNEPDPQVCNGAKQTTSECSDASCKKAADAGSHAACASKANPIIDLLGNVEEWVAECKAPGATGNCNVRGGSFLDENLTCSASSGAPAERKSTSGARGFRCCAYE